MQCNCNDNDMSEWIILEVRLYDSPVCMNTESVNNIIIELALTIYNNSNNNIIINNAFVRKGLLLSAGREFTKRTSDLLAEVSISYFLCHFKGIVLCGISIWYILLDSCVSAVYIFRLLYYCSGPGRWLHEIINWWEAKSRVYMYVCMACFFNNFKPFAHVYIYISSISLPSSNAHQKKKKKKKSRPFSSRTNELCPTPALEICI